MVIKRYSGGIFKSYSDYLNSWIWKEKRNNFLEHKKRICEICKGRATEIHHKNYHTVEFERKRDLIAVCRNCHKKIHRGVCNDSK